jgi:hypothetical protein
MLEASQQCNRAVQYTLRAYIFRNMLSKAFEELTSNLIIGQMFFIEGSIMSYLTPA